jgi:two-component system, chemotaxis family, protein-glutamate methylesterase/glutaminase
MIVAVGAWAGTVETLPLLLAETPSGLAMAVLVVIHVPVRSPSILARISGRRTAMRIKEAERGEATAAGTIYFAPPDHHLRIAPEETTELTDEPPVRFSRPSVDVLFLSAAAALRDESCDVVLTGSSDDGEAGLRAIGDAGGTMLVQDPGTADAPAMPLAELEQCPEARVGTVPNLVMTLGGWEAEESA